MFGIEGPALGTFFAAIIAATVSLLGLIISKEQKTSEFRQEWINALRNDLSLFLTQFNAIRDSIEIEFLDYSDKVENLRPLYSSLNSATFNILLRVNPKEKRSVELLNVMERFNELTRSEQEFTSKNMRSIEREFLDAAQRLLKAEWARVKSGETTFRFAKFSALAIILFSLVSVGISELFPMAINGNGSSTSSDCKSLKNQITATKLQNIITPQKTMEPQHND